ncbi:unnamed protein product [Lactuca saligna]|uniref:Uncharacterized protein n=1 Tax=Lactuca saligna TaxID=75948 RepID=A0AA35ZN40_LACSI|nr:unnamed protein product [Lactuca saligna]
MLAPPPPSPGSIYSPEFLNLNDLHTIVCDCGDKIVAYQIKMHRLNDKLGKDFILCRVDHIDLQHKLEDQDKKVKAIVCSDGQRHGSNAWDDSGWGHSPYEAWISF